MVSQTCRLRLLEIEGAPATPDLWDRLSTVYRSHLPDSQEEEPQGCYQCRGGRTWFQGKYPRLSAQSYKQGEDDGWARLAGVVAKGRQNVHSESLASLCEPTPPAQTKHSSKAQTHTRSREEHATRQDESRCLGSLPEPAITQKWSKLCE